MSQNHLKIASDQSCLILNMHFYYIQQIPNLVPSPQDVYLKIKNLCERIFDSILTQQGKLDLLQEDKNENSSYLYDFRCFNLIKLESNTIQKEYLNYNNFQTIKTLSRYIKLLERILKLLIENKYSNKREIYYQDIQIFENQENLDLCLKKLAYYLQLPRISLNIVSAGKGLFAGNIQFNDIQNEGMGFLNLGNNGTQINQLHINADFQTSAKFILIVEKETIFFKLLSENQSNLLDNCILITGKGYPDQQTKRFIKKIIQLYRYLPVFCLCDFDPFGFDILINYAIGTKWNVYEYDCIPNCFFLGILNQDINNIENLKINLNEFDQRKIQELKIRMKYINNNFFDQFNYLQLDDMSKFQSNKFQKWEQQLNFMCDGKLEVENLYDFLDCQGQSLSDFICQKIINGYFI